MNGGGWVPKVWYFCHFAALSTLFPFVNLFFRRLGLSEQHIGLLTAFRPWVSFPAGSLWSGLADKLRAHRPMLLALLAAATLARLSLSAAASFGTALALVLCTEFFAAPVTIIVDAAVTAACTKEGEYGRQRLFGAIGWGIFSAVAGAIISHRGIYAAFVCHGVLSLLTAIPTALLPFGPLHAKLKAQHAGGSGRSSSGGSSGDGCRDSYSSGSRGGTSAGAAAFNLGGEGSEGEEEQGLWSGQGSGLKGAGQVELGKLSGRGQSPPQSRHKPGRQEATGRLGGLGQRAAFEKHADEPSLQQEGSSWGSGSAAASGWQLGAEDEEVEWQPEAAEGEGLEEAEQQPLLLEAAGGSSASKGGTSSGSGSRSRGDEGGACPALPTASSGQQRQWDSTAQPGSAGQQGCSSAKGQQPKEQGSAAAPTVHFWRGMGQLLSNPHALIFFGQAITMGFGVGNIESYLFLYLDGLGASETLMGLSLSVTCAAEVVVFWFSGRIIQGLGIRLCMHLVFLAFLVRLLCYATLARWGSLWKVMPVETLHGFTFALAWSTATAFAARVAPPGLEATAQALVQGLYFGVGYGLGGLVGGVVYQRYGAQQVYWVAFGVLLAGWLASAVLEVLVGWWSNGKEEYGQLQMEVLDVTEECI